MLRFFESFEFFESSFVGKWGGVRFGSQSEIYYIRENNDRSSKLPWLFWSEAGIRILAKNRLRKRIFFRKKLRSESETKAKRTWNYFLRFRCSKMRKFERKIREKVIFSYFNFRYFVLYEKFPPWQKIEISEKLNRADQKLFFWH